MTNVTQLPTAAESPALVAAREELGLLHEIFAAMGEARMRAIEHEKAGKVLGYIHALLTDAQARYDALVPPAPTQAAATDAPPVIASKEPETSAPVAG